MKKWWNAARAAQPEPADPSESPPAETVRKHLLFHGHVQGVGFRYEASRLARELALVGWIRNNFSGDVEAELEGPAARIDLLVQALRSISRIRITAVEEEPIPPRGDEKRFRVLY